MKTIFFILPILFSIANGYSFMSIGDWGAAYFGGFHLKNAQDTSYAMENWSKINNAQFVINTGDNFYYCGIQNTTDIQIIKDYTNIFSKIQLPWYSSLGNHDYGLNPDAQLELDKTLPYWVMDNRYYHRRIEYQPNLYLNLVILDTSPCVNDYRGNNRHKWDPCNPEYPSCGPISGQCLFHENVIAQDCNIQYDWFKQIIEEINDNEWILVFGHHRADQIDNVDFQTILDSPKVNLYINGHVHSLEHYAINGQSKYITSGAACMVILPHPIHKHEYGNTRNLWWKSKTGFTGHSIFDNVLTTYFLDVDNNILHQFNVSLSKK